ncbi:N-acetylglucosamine kinase [Cohnella candidum]|uniref:N-acetylglucosamine kinase n=1 Tax=Cohnella candidum TaxID=2674991 RepID=A0A3G3JWN4_9BACL|nr:BadF/BadG/BcrA/BcrD ATPase family protein [Cohnella candidum]AYQ72636.1 N-acetylglucosamine kinase [Cohnella candidum]
MANPNCVIGVDGGNSKTDYFLFDIKGNFIDHIRAGTCSHERFPDGYVSAHRVMNENISELLGRNGLAIEDVKAAAFGLAGADVPSQKKRLSEILERIGFNLYAVDNDSFLGIKAGCPTGSGICSINGSGTVTGGISPSGRRLQVGGVGSELSGDEAGGYFLARKVLRAVYDSFYRLGPKTGMTGSVMTLLGIQDQEIFLETALDGVVNRTLPNTELMRILFAAADAGDGAALEIVDRSAEQLARSTAGCMNSLDFGEEVDIVLAGSVWVKAETPLLLDRYKKYVAQWTTHSCRYSILDVPPAAGAILWALELTRGHAPEPEPRRKVIHELHQRINNGR